MQSYDVWPGIRKALWAALYVGAYELVEGVRTGLEQSCADTIWLPAAVFVLTFVGHWLRRTRQARTGENG